MLGTKGNELLTNEEKRDGKGMEWKYGGYIRGMTRLGARERERHRCYYEMRGEPKAARARERARVRGI